MAASNINKFDEYTGQILARLYQNFPVPMDISPRDFFTCSAVNVAEDEWEYTDEDAKVFLSTARWLVLAGYIHCVSEKRSYLYKSVLTAKGLEVLKLVPSSVQGGLSIGEQLTTAATEEARETLRGVVSEALSIGARLISPLVGLSS